MVLSTISQMYWWFVSQNKSFKLLLIISYGYIIVKDAFVVPIEKLHSKGVSKQYQRDQSCNVEDAMSVGRACTSVLTSFLSSFWIFVVSSFLVLYKKDDMSGLTIVPVALISGKISDVIFRFITQEVYSS